MITARSPSGRPSRAGEVREFPPAQVKRLLDNAMKGMADPEWGTAAGQLYARGKITAPMYAAAKRWAERADRYHDAISAPKPNPRALNLERGALGAPPDPDSPEGQEHTASDQRAVKDFMAAHSALNQAGRLAEQVVRATCERDDMPVGAHERDALCRGLIRLSEFWGLTNQVKHGGK